MTQPSGEVPIRVRGYWCTDREEIIGQGICKGEKPVKCDQPLISVEETVGWLRKEAHELDAMEEGHGLPLSDDRWRHALRWVADQLETLIEKEKA